VHGGRDKGRDRQTVGKRDREGIVPGGFDRSDPNKNQRECSDEFGEAGAKLIHPAMQSDCSGCDK
jgi:hypothetical protein